MMTSASFEVETPILCIECKAVLESQFIDGKVYVKPCLCKVPQSSLQKLLNKVEKLYDSMEGECENHPETCTECGKCDLGHALNETAEILCNVMEAAQQKIKESQANTQQNKSLNPEKQD